MIKRKWRLILISIVVFCAIGFPMYLYIKTPKLDDKAVTSITAQTSFGYMHQNVDKILGFGFIELPLVTYVNGGYVHSEVFVNGKWIEVAKNEVPKENQSEVKP